MRVSAGVVSIFLGLGFGLPGIAGARHFARTGEVWTFMGFPTYGGGPFERVGLTTSTGLIVAFVMVCLAEALVGVALMADVPGASTMAHVLLPFELAFWIGFALPLGPVFGAVRTVLLLF